MTVFVPPDGTSVLRYRNPVILFWMIPALIAWSGGRSAESSPANTGRGCVQRRNPRRGLELTYQYLDNQQTFSATCWCAVAD